jgi:hypothetical protein
VIQWHLSISTWGNEQLRKDWVWLLTERTCRKLSSSDRGDDGMELEFVLRPATAAQAWKLSISFIPF